MFQRLENIFNAIKGFFGFFGSIFQYIITGFVLITHAMQYVIDFFEDMAYNWAILPPFVLSFSVIVLLVWVIRTITGRLNK